MTRLVSALVQLSVQVSQASFSCPRVPGSAWLPVELLEHLPGVPIKPLPLAFGKHRYRAGLVIRRSAADFKPFSNLVNTIRSVALKSRR